MERLRGSELAQHKAILEAGGKSNFYLKYPWGTLIRPQHMWLPLDLLGESGLGRVVRSGQRLLRLAPSTKTAAKTVRLLHLALLLLRPLWTASPGISLIFGAKFCAWCISQEHVRGRCRNVRRTRPAGILAISVWARIPLVALFHAPRLSLVPRRRRPEALRRRANRAWPTSPGTQ